MVSQSLECSLPSPTLLQRFVNKFIFYYTYDYGFNLLRSSAMFYASLAVVMPMEISCELLSPLKGGEDVKFQLGKSLH